MSDAFYHWRRNALSHIAEKLLLTLSMRLAWKSAKQDSDLDGDSFFHSSQHSDFYPSQTGALSLSGLGQAGSIEDFNPLYPNKGIAYGAHFGLLQKQYPVHCLDNGIYYISRYEDIQSVSKNTAGYSSRFVAILGSLAEKAEVEKIGRRLQLLANIGLAPDNVLGMSDPPTHTQQRELLELFFSNGALEPLEGMAQTLAHELVQNALQRERIDFVSQIGWPHTVRLLCRVFGLPEKDYPLLWQWCKQLFKTPLGRKNVSHLALQYSVILRVMRYMWARYDEKSNERSRDLIGILQRACRIPSTGMHDGQAVGIVFQSLIGGAEPSVSALTGALRLLIENPGMAEVVRNNLDEKLDPFIEEVLRLDSPYQGHFRWVQQDGVSLHGVALPKNARVYISWAAANRDASVFPNPEAIDLNRPNGKQHLGFGYGVHECLGAHLVRLQMRVVLREILTMTKNLRFESPPDCTLSMFSRNYERMPIGFEPRETGDTLSPAVASKRPRMR